MVTSSHYMRSDKEKTIANHSEILHKTAKMVR